MKRWIVAVSLLLLLLSLVGCQELEQILCSHEVVVDAQRKPTCVDMGLSEGSHCGKCGKVLKKQEVIRPAGHVKVEIPGVEPSCTEPGRSASLQCSVCHMVLKASFYLPKAEHTPEVIPAQAASCTQQGKTEGSRCAVCKKTLKNQLVVAALGHTQARTPGKAPSCTEAGLSDLVYCSVCKDVLYTQEVVPATGHTVVIDAAVEATCQSKGKTEGSHCGTCGVTLKAQKAVAKVGHKGVKIPAVAATCQSTGLTEGKACKWCDKILTAQKSTPKTGHKEVVVPAVLPGKNTTGRTQGTQCKYCQKVYIEALDPDRYNNRYGYEYLGTMKNGEDLQAVYDRLDHLARSFHLDASEDAEYVESSSSYITGFVDVTDMNLLMEDIRIVMRTYFYEHQLYYWYESFYYYHNRDTKVVTRFALTVDPDYAEGEKRAAQNLRIYRTVQEMAIESNSAYTLAKHYHDTILKNMEYAYEADGKTPEDARWAHTIVGYVDHGAGVCETYTEIFHVMLNFSGVECIRVHGTGNGGNHAWNLAKMDDGNWYWFDLTWDDYENYYGYNYFCLNDTQKIAGGKETFLTSHTYSTVDSGNRFLVPLPKRSQKVYPR